MQVHIYTQMKTEEGKQEQESILNRNCSFCSNLNIKGSGLIDVPNTGGLNSHIGIYHGEHSRYRNALVLTPGPQNCPHIVIAKGIKDWTTNQYQPTEALKNIKTQRVCFFLYNNGSIAGWQRHPELVYNQGRDTAYSKSVSSGCN